MSRLQGSSHFLVVGGSVALFCLTLLDALSWLLQMRQNMVPIFHIKWLLLNMITLFDFIIILKSCIISVCKGYYSIKQSKNENPKLKALELVGGSQVRVCDVWAWWATFEPQNPPKQKNIVAMCLYRLSTLWQEGGVWGISWKYVD